MLRVFQRTSDASRDGYFPSLAGLVRRANSVELLVVLAAPDAEADFWNKTATVFRDYPNVVFEAAPSAVGAIFRHEHHDFGNGARVLGRS